jgi:hypothetical protein
LQQLFALIAPWISTIYVFFQRLSASSFYVFLDVLAVYRFIHARILIVDV